MYTNLTRLLNYLNSSEPGPKLPVRHRSPPMRAALAEVLPRSTPENATIDPETR